MNVKHSYYSDGQIRKTRYLDDNNTFHNENGPAFIEYYRNGKEKSIVYYIHGCIHNENGPAEIKYYHNGIIQYEYYYINNNLHRTNGPAKIKYFQDGTISKQTFYKNGKKHNQNGPAFQDFYCGGRIKEEQYCIENKLHRVNGPALLIYDCHNNLFKEQWYINGKLHRDNNPASITNFSSGISFKEFYQHGVLFNPNGPTETIYRNNKLEQAQYLNKDLKLHNLNGPAKITYGPDESVYEQIFFIDGTVYSELEYYVYIGSLKEENENDQ